MLYCTNNDTGITEVCIIGMYNSTVYIAMIAHYVNENTIEIFHLMPLTPDDAYEFDFEPGTWYDYPKKINKRNEDNEEDWWY